MSSDDISVRIEEHVAFKVCGKKYGLVGRIILNLKSSGARLISPAWCRN